MQLEKLSQVGVDWEDGVKRLLGKKDLYIKFLNRFLEDHSMANIENAMRDRDYESAFKAAHTLKGTSGNLGMRSLYDEVYVFVENLRGKEYGSAEHQYSKVKDAYDSIIRAIEELV